MLDFSNFFRFLKGEKLIKNEPCNRTARFGNDLQILKIYFLQLQRRQRYFGNCFFVFDFRRIRKIEVRV